MNLPVLGRTGLVKAFVQKLQALEEKNSERLPKQHGMDQLSNTVFEKYLPSPPKIIIKKIASHKVSRRSPV